MTARLGKFFFVTGVLLTSSAMSYALPFNVAPKAGTSLPTQIFSGQTATALYTVVNSSRAARAGNYVKYLPPNTAQVTTDPTYADLCGSTFALQPNGAAGSSCTLELTVSGAVNSNDPDPHHHLFVCYSDNASCAGTSFPLNVTLNPTPPKVVVSGLYDAPASLQKGLLLVSSDRGKDWTTPSVTLPANFSSAGSLVSATCTSTACIAAGVYTASSPSTSLPFIEVSNAVNTWAPPASIALPTDFASAANLQSLFCSGSFCVSVGYYTNSRQVPLVVISNNNGSTWVQPNSISLTGVDIASNGQAAAVTCAGSFCAAAGSFDTNLSVLTPVILISSDNGQDWSVPTINGPSDFSGNASLPTMACTSSNCITAGQYTDTGSVNRPLIYVSSNNGSTWTGIEKTSVTLPSGTTSSNIDALVCNSTNCLAGQSYSVGATQFPLILVSANNGNTWNPATVTNPTDFHGSGTIYSMNCSGSICQAGGFYSNLSSVISPLLLVSNNNGNTWTPSAITLPADFASTGLVVNVACSGANCVAGGAYTNTSSKGLPLLLYSSDTGNTWSPAVSVGLPADYSTGGTVYSVANGDLPSLAKVGGMREKSFGLEKVLREKIIL